MVKKNVPSLKYQFFSITKQLNSYPIIKNKKIKAIYDSKSVKKIATIFK